MPPSVSGPRRYKSLETGNCIGIPGGQLLFRHGQTALPHLVSCAKSTLRRFVLYIDRSSHHAYIKEKISVSFSLQNLAFDSPSGQICSIAVKNGHFLGFNKVLDSFWGWGKLGHNLPTPSRRPKLRPLGIVPPIGPPLSGSRRRRRACCFPPGMVFEPERPRVGKNLTTLDSKRLTGSRVSLLKSRGTNPNPVRSFICPISMIKSSTPGGRKRCIFLGTSFETTRASDWTLQFSATA